MPGCRLMRSLRDELVEVGVAAGRGAHYVPAILGPAKQPPMTLASLVTNYGVAAWHVRCTANIAFSSNI